MPVSDKAAIVNLGGSGDGVQSVTGSAVNNTDPKNPVVDIPEIPDFVESVSGNVVDNSDPQNPEVNAVASVTGSWVDNDDPANPVVQFSVEDRLSSVSNDGENVLIMNDAGDDEICPVSASAVNAGLFECFDTGRWKVSQTIIHALTVIANVEEGAGSADILYYLTASDDVDGLNETVASPGVFREYVTDSSSFAISVRSEFDSSKFYALRARNIDGGNATFTSNSYTTDFGDVLVPAFIMQMSRVVVFN